MHPPKTKPGQPARHGVAHATAALVLGLLVAASIDPLRPIAREVQRETAPERAAVRELTATLAKAVRSLCGSPTVKPVALAGAAASAIDADGAATATRGRDASDAAPAPVRLRAELLDLPPPARA